MKRWGAEEKTRLWKAADDIAVSHEDAFRKEAQAQFGKDRREILALVSDAKRKSLQQKAAIQWEALLPDVAEVLAAAGERWNQAFVPLIAGVVTDAAEHWKTEAGLAFDVRNFEAEDWFTEYVAQFSTPIQDTSAREISALLQQGARDGWTTGQMQKALGQTFQQWVDGNTDAADFAGERLPPWRTELIARTETAKAYGFGSTKIYKSAGVQQKEWLATLDNRTREAHAEADGQVVGVDEPFSVGGEEVMFPGDGSPENSVDCRCTVLPVIEE